MKAESQHKYLNSIHDSTKENTKNPEIQQRSNAYPINTTGGPALHDSELGAWLQTLSFLLFHPTQQHFFPSKVK